MAEKKKGNKVKVFQFSRNGEHYTIASLSKMGAKNYLLEYRGVTIPNCFEVPESEWSDRGIVIGSGELPKILDL